MKAFDRLIVSLIILVTCWNTYQIYNMADRTDQLRDAVKLLAKGLLEVKNER